uniref:Uncharacterized protein n=1 Tax=Romanomermis culicivorax TaxID=13658 RepID=A0A915JMG7_ROMCU
MNFRSLTFDSQTPLLLHTPTAKILRISDTLPQESHPTPLTSGPGYISKMTISAGKITILVSFLFTDSVFYQKQTRKYQSFDRK